MKKYLIVGISSYTVHVKQNINMKHCFFSSKTIIFATFLINTQMRVKTKGRIVIAWVLFMALMPFFVVKAIHHHKESETVVCHSEDGHSENPCGQCLICHFTLSPFTQAKSFYTQVIIPAFNYEPVYYVNMIGYQLIHSHKLRAPPSLSILL